MKFCSRLVLFMLAIVCFIQTNAQNLSLGSLKQNQKTNGFTAQAVYLNDAGQPMGARFFHDRTGFTFDLLQIESVPQTFIYVNSLPVSDKGEPHTQEHLLITKGNKGHELNTRQGMSLAFSNAFTSQVYTAYHFNTAGSGEVFYNLFEGYMDALLHPDYTDEEVNREVMNWGVAEDAATKKLRLEEKGSVYNEMKTSMNSAFRQVAGNMGRMLYGDAHPLSYNAGGSTEGIRIMNAADIKRYHDLNYHLSNMGAIVSLPKAMNLQSVLQRTNTILNRLQPKTEKLTVVKSIPPAQPAQAGTVKIVDYPSANEQDPGIILFGYPATLKLDAKNDLMLNVFFGTIAGDAGTNLYKIFIDGKTREPILDAKSVFAYTDEHQGQPNFIGFSDVNPSNLTEEKAKAAWTRIQLELKNIAAYKDGSPELLEFNARIKTNLTDYRRTLAKLTNTPPLFGGRNTGDTWFQQLEEMTKIRGFKKSLIMVPEFNTIDAMLASGKNFWGEYLSRWQLINSNPYIVISHANPKLLQQQETEAKERADAQLALFKSKYNVTDDQEAIRRYKAEYDANTAILEKAEQGHSAKFIDNPPLTLDDQLNYKVSTLPNKIPLVSSVFDNMSGATTGIALNMNKMPQDKLVYLAMLPQLLTQTGLFKDGRGISFADMTQLQRKQILSLNAYYSSNYLTPRAELVVKGAGNNSTESVTAVSWMNDVLQYPYWKTENLSRIRDLVNQSLSNMRKTMQGREEAWVRDPANAYRAQDNPLLLATTSFLTRTHNVQRLRWMLMDAGSDADRSAASAYLLRLEIIKGSREDLNNLLKAIRTDNAQTIAMPNDLAVIAAAYSTLPANTMKTIKEAANDLQQTLTELPDATLAADWKYLCRQMRNDMEQGPEKTLADLEELRKTMLHSANARMFVIGSTAGQAALQPNIKRLLSGLSNETLRAVKFSSTKLIDQRVQKRLGTTEGPIYVGLINTNSATGVFINSAPILQYRDTSHEKQYEYLASLLHAGGGKQSVYTKSTGAGLSYSTGANNSPAAGLFTYYAERTPLLPQTLAFIIDEIKKTPNDPEMRSILFHLP
ncbi:MAG: insulinase family protein [Ferruginibacter sp.]